MNETRQFFGALLAFGGLLLLVVPLFLLNGGGTPKEELLPMVQALGSISGGVLALIFSWFLLRRF